MIGRIVKSADFERVLRTPARSRSGPFVFHHLAERPTRRAGRAEAASAAELSTAVGPLGPAPVDDSPAAVDDSAAAGPGVWLGAVVPKRHARRAVSRSLIKRQIRAAFARHGHLLDAGLWVVRLRAPFDRAVFPSAASAALQAAVRDDIAVAMSAALRPRAARRGAR